jgi:hypothetical protein
MDDKLVQAHADPAANRNEATRMPRHLGEIVWTQRRKHLLELCSALFESRHDSRRPGVKELLNRRSAPSPYSGNIAGPPWQFGLSTTPGRNDLSVEIAARGEMGHSINGLPARAIRWALPVCFWPAAERLSHAGCLTGNNRNIGELFLWL